MRWREQSDRGKAHSEKTTVCNQSHQKKEKEKGTKRGFEKKSMKITKEGNGFRKFSRVKYPNTCSKFENAKKLQSSIMQTGFEWEKLFFHQRPKSNGLKKLKQCIQIPVGS